MKKTLIALAALAVAGTAFAQSSVSISGGMRVGIKNNDAGTIVSPDQGSGNTINFNVVEDLGGGMAFTGSSQLRYVSDSGKLDNSSNFHLVAIGLKGGFGAVQAGRIGLDQFWGYSPFGSNGAHTNPSGAGATENGQIRYTSPTFSGLNVVLASTQKGNTTGATDNGSQFLVNYKNGPLSVSALSEKITTGSKLSGFAASYDLGVAKAMFISAKTKTAAGAVTADGQSFGVTVPMGAITLKAAFKNDKLAANQDKTSIGVDYALSKRTTLEANTYKTKNETTVTGQNTWVGVRHSF